MTEIFEMCVAHGMYPDVYNSVFSVETSIGAGIRLEEVQGKTYTFMIIDEGMPEGRVKELEAKRSKSASA